MLKGENKRSELVFCHVYDDFEEFSEAARSWNLEFVQLERGLFRGELFQFQVDGLQGLHARFNRQLLQRGSSPKGMQTFAVVGENSSLPIWRNKEVHQDSIMVFADKSLDVVTREGFEVFSFSISDEIFNTYIQALGYPEPEKVYKGSDAIIGYPETTLQLRRHLNQLMDTINRNSQVINNQRFTHQMKHDLSADLLDVFTSPQNISVKTAPRIDESRFKMIETYITENSTNQPTISDLCKIAYCSERTLRRAFWERYGTSPMRYIKYLQLNRARKELRQARPGNIKIADIANRWGFWHMGQFAFDYRQLFGELPSSTLINRVSRSN